MLTGANGFLETQIFRALDNAGHLVAVRDPAALPAARRIAAM
jgi:hypothetical protein